MVKIGKLALKHVNSWGGTTFTLHPVNSRNLGKLEAVGGKKGQHKNHGWMM